MEEVYTDRGVMVVVLGKQYDTLDDTATRNLEENLRVLGESADPPRILLDMEKTEGIGSTFLASLFGSERRLKARGGHLALCQVGPFCAEVLEIVKAERVLRIFPTREAAITALLEEVPVTSH